jgi:hypothetical protein
VELLVGKSLMSGLEAGGVVLILFGSLIFEIGAMVQRRLCKCYHSRKSASPNSREALIASRDREEETEEGSVNVNN